jgi:hypothetical protein
MSATKHWQQLPDGRLECDLCPRLCKLAEGERGDCRMRVCDEGAVVFSPPGRLFGVRIEPVEALSLTHFLPGSGERLAGVFGGRPAAGIDWSGVDWSGTAAEPGARSLGSGALGASGRSAA